MQFVCYGLLETVRGHESELGGGDTYQYRRTVESKIRLDRGKDRRRCQVKSKSPPVPFVIQFVTYCRIFPDLFFSFLAHAPTPCPTTHHHRSARHSPFTIHHSPWPWSVPRRPIPRFSFRTARFPRRAATLLLFPVP